MILTFINFSWRLWAQIKHVYLIKFTQVVWLLTNWWIAMNETNLTQHGRSTDVNASDVLYLRDKKKTLKKRGNLLRTTSSFYGNSCRVRMLINIIMVCVRAALIIKALVYEFKLKHNFLKHFQNIFLNMILDLKIWCSRSYIASLFLLFHSKIMTPKNCLTCNFSLQYQYILQPTVLENKETYQLDGVKLMQHFIL